MVDGAASLMCLNIPAVILVEVLLNEVKEMVRRI
jgi:hypothetical protein